MGIIKQLAVFGVILIIALVSERRDRNEVNKVEIPSSRGNHITSSAIKTNSVMNIGNIGKL